MPPTKKTALVKKTALAKKNPSLKPPPILMVQSKLIQQVVTIPMLRCLTAQKKNWVSAYFLPISVSTLQALYSKSKSYMVFTVKSPIYQFFKTDVTIKYDNQNRLYHWFHCAAQICKSGRGVWRYQDKKDKSSTGNLRHHAKRCWGLEAVQNISMIGAKDITLNGSIFALFARNGQKPVNVSHRSHTSNCKGSG